MQRTTLYNRLQSLFVTIDLKKGAGILVDINTIALAVVLPIIAVFAAKIILERHTKVKRK